MQSFPAGMRVAIFGASGGIGSAVLHALAARGCTSHIYAFARSVAPSLRHLTASSQVSIAPFDVTDETSIRAAAESCSDGGPLHLVFIATGVLHSSMLQPEKTWRSLEADALAASFAVNAIGPALIAKHFLDLLAPRTKSVFAAISARVGSIEDNRLGGWHAYRASKAALHQIIRTCSVELARRNSTAICVALHPGTVNTALSRPFQANVAPAKLFTPQYAAERLLAVIDELTPAQTGNAFAWNGERIPF
jgi:NAD(P)-dependent dehydrogenase (short-subunit alcohol dehydrogenase family)